MIADLESQRLPLEEVYASVQSVAQDTEENQYQVSELNYEQQISPHRQHEESQVQVNHKIVDEATPEISQPDLPCEPLIGPVV